MPAGMRLVDGRWYWRATDEKTRAVMQKIAPGKRNVRAGVNNATPDGARQWWVETILPSVKEETPGNLPKPGTVAEIIGRYEIDVLPSLAGQTHKEEKRYCANLHKAFGHWRYAKSEAEASTGPFLRSLHITQHLRSEANSTRRVAANREVKSLSRIFRLGKTRWGYTEYNPCLQVEYNPEFAREEYQDDAAFMKVYGKASPILQCMMDLAQMNGCRRGMLLRGSLADITDDGLWFTLNKRRRQDGKPDRPKRKLAPWTDDLREVVARIQELRAAVRGGQRKVDDLATAPLFLNRKGKAVTVTGFNSMWQRAARAAGFEAHQFHFHDIKAKALSDSPSLADAQERGDHLDQRTTRGVYRRRPAVVVPLARVSKRKAS